MAKRNPLYRQKEELMGKIVTVKQEYYRDFDFEINSIDSTHEYRTRNIEEPKAGWVVGFRTVYNGINTMAHHNHEGELVGGEWTPVQGIHCMLVSYWHNRKPVLVPISYDAFEVGGKPEYRTAISEEEKERLRAFAKSLPRNDKGQFVRKDAICNQA